MLMKSSLIALPTTTYSQILRMWGNVCFYNGVISNECAYLMPSEKPNPF